MGYAVPYYFSVFKPFGYQQNVLGLLHHYDYKKNFYPEILLSGSVGSAKSSLLAHIAILHCVTNRRARVGISRMGMPDLKKTLYREILDAIENDPSWKEATSTRTLGITGNYFALRDKAEIHFANGSTIEPMTFGDRNWGRPKSYLFSLVLMEEATEFEDEFYTVENSGFDLLRGRINRLAHIRQNALILATNPGEPDHFLFDYFVEGEKHHSNRFVFYSNTEENEYLDPNYIKQLKASYSPLMAERYLRGRWVSLLGKGVYHAYRATRNFRRRQWQVREEKPIHICFDFNVGDGKPMSSSIFQYYDDAYHFFAESIVDNSVWCLDCLEDYEAKGYLSPSQRIIIHGDSTGNSRSANSKVTNYELIKEWLTNRGYTFKIQVPRSNPPISTRHIKVNALCQNDLGENRLFVYKTCPVLNQGLKLTKFKKNSALEKEDRYQHVTTAIGYGICANEKILKRRKASPTSYIRTGTQ